MKLNIVFNTSKLDAELYSVEVLQEIAQKDVMSKHGDAKLIRVDQTGFDIEVPNAKKSLVLQMNLISPAVLWVTNALNKVAKTNVPHISYSYSRQPDGSGIANMTLLPR